MKYAIMALAAAAVFILLFLIIKKADTAAENHRQNSGVEPCRNRFCVGFENPLTAEQILPLIETVSKKVPECEIHFFCAPRESIRESILRGKLDFGFILADSASQDQKLNVMPLSLTPGQHLCSMEGITIEPLTDEPLPGHAVWRRDSTNGFVKKLADLLDDKFGAAQAVSLNRCGKSEDNVL